MGDNYPYSSYLFSCFVGTPAANKVKLLEVINCSHHTRPRGSFEIRLSVARFQV